MPWTLQLGWRLAKSRAQIPEPVPTSRMDVGFSAMGARCNAPSRETSQMLCWVSAEVSHSPFHVLIHVWPQT